MIDKDRFITTVYLTPVGNYYIKGLDTHTFESFYFVVYPSGNSQAMEFIANPGKAQNKKILPPKITEAIVAYLEVLETQLQ